MNISGKEIDALKEILNIGVGKSTETLNTMLQTPVCLEVQSVSVKKYHEIIDESITEMRISYSSVKMTFGGAFPGEVTLLFSKDCAGKIVNMFTGNLSASDDLDTIMTGTLTEIGNIILNAIMSTIGKAINQKFAYTVPSYLVGNYKSIYTHETYNTLLFQAKTCFIIENIEIEGEIGLHVDIKSFKKLVTAVL